MGDQVQLLEEGVRGRQAARPLLHGHDEDGGAGGVRGEVSEHAWRAAVVQDVGQPGGQVPNDLVRLVVCAGWVERQVWLGSMATHHEAQREVRMAGSGGG